MNFKIVDNSEYVLNCLRGQAESAIKAVGESMVSDVKNQMLTGYSESHPNPYPHTSILITGELINSIQCEFDSHFGSQTHTASVGTNVPYAKYVHEGTYKLNGRPFIRDSLEKNASKYESLIEVYLKQK